MGYTNYMRTPAVMDADKFKLLSEELETVSGLLPAHSESARTEPSKEFIVIRGGDGEGSPVFNENVIAFNGDKKDDMYHETFAIERVKRDSRSEKGLVFDFCKTARKPYDLMVKISMLRLKYHFPECELSCDGVAADWKQAKKVYKKVFGGTIPKID